jgi:tape measure domain-containing protein
MQQSTKGSMEEMSAAIKAMSDHSQQAMTAMQESIRATSEHMITSNSKMGSSLGSLSGLLQGFGGAIAAIGLLTLAKQAVTVMASFEQLQVSLNSVMGSAAEGQKAFAWVKQFAVDTPYEVDQVANSFRMLKAYGIDPTNGSLKAISDMAAYTGRGVEGLNSATLGLGQAWTRAKLQGQDIMQLINVGIPVWDILAKATGKNTAELMKMSEKGMLGRDAITALMAGMEEVAGGAAAAQMDTLNGKWSNFTDAIKNALDEIRRNGALDGLKVALDGLVALIPSVSSVFQAFGGLVSTIVNAVAYAWDMLTQSISAGAGQQIGFLDIVKIAFEMVRIAIVAFKTAVEYVLEVIKGSLTATGAELVAFADIAKAAFHLDWDGVSAAWKRGVTDVEAIVKQSAENIKEINRKSIESMSNFGGVGFTATAPKVETNTKLTPKSGNALIEKPVATDKGVVKGFETELAERKVAYQEAERLEGSFKEFSKQQEVDFWQSKLSLVTKGTESEKAVRMNIANLKLAIDKQNFSTEMANLKASMEAVKNDTDAKLVIANKYADKMRAAYGRDSVQYAEAQKQIVAIHRQAFEQRKQIDDIYAKTLESHKLDLVTQEQEASRLRTELGLQTKLQEIQQEQQFENQIYQIKEKALQDSLALAAKDPDKNPVLVAQINAQLLQLQQQHDAKMRQLSKQSTLEQNKNWKSMFDTIKNGLANIISGMLSGTMTMATAIKSMFQMVAQAVIETLAKVAAEWVIQKATEMILSKTAATAGVAGNAAVAASAAMASVAAIPLYGWAMAPEVGAATYAAAMAYSVPAAEQGFDIPAGVNPLTQLHEKEMVLPRAQADAVRSMAEGGGSGGEIHLHVHAVDSKSVERLFKDNGKHIATAVQQQMRQFNMGKR